MADIEAEIARLQAEIDQRRLQTEALRNNQAQLTYNNHQQVVEQEYDEVEEVSEYSEYEEEEIIEEYDDEEWEEEIIEEEIVDEEDEVLEEEVEEIVIIEDDDEPSTVMCQPPATIPPVYESVPSTMPSTLQQTGTHTQTVASNTVIPAAPAPLTTQRKWTPSYLRKQEENKPAVPATPAPVSPRWKRPTSVAVPPPPQAAPTSAPSWATKQQSKTKPTTPVPIITSAGSAPTVMANASAEVAHTPEPTFKVPAVRNKPLVRPPPDAKGNVKLNDPPPGLDNDGKPKGPRIKIINWGANRRSNTAIQSETRPNFKPGVPGGSTTDPDKVKRNYVIPKGVKSPLGAPDEKNNGAAATTAKACSGGHKRRTIPDIPVSVPGEETVWEKLLGPKLIANCKLHKKNTTGCLKDVELVGLYFGCKMKPECKYFHPRLQDFYFSGQSQNQNMEIIYISSDRTLNDFKELFARMPYLAIPGGGTASIKNNLSNLLKVIEQPTLVMLDDEGMVITVDAVQQIQSLERGNVEQANALISRWKRTRPVSMEQVQRDFALQYGKLQRGILYWQE